MNLVREDRPLMSVTELRHPSYSLLVWRYLLGQYRIQLTDRRIPDVGCPEGHGSIVQNLCTYKAYTVINVVAELGLSEDPLALAQSWARPWNSEGDRIRLDNEEKERNTEC